MTKKKKTNGIFILITRHITLKKVLVYSSALKNYNPTITTVSYNYYHNTVMCYG